MRYVVIVVSASFGSWKVTRIYAFACLSWLGRWNNLSATEAEVKREVGANSE